MRVPLAASTTLLLALLAAGCSTISSRHDGPIAELVHVAGPTPASIKMTARDEVADTDGPVRHGGYVAVYNGAESVNGDFNGTGIITGVNGDVFLVPDLAVDSSYGLILGTRRPERAFELWVQYSEHDDSFLGLPGSTDVLMAGVAWKEFWLVDQALQPYSILGLSLPFLTVEQGVANGAQVEDSQLDGYAIDVGAGLAFHPEDHWSIFGQGVYRFSRVVHADGILDEGPIAPDIDSDGWAIQVGVAYTF